MINVGLNLNLNLNLASTHLSAAHKQQIPPKLTPWLTSTGSLTAKFEALSRHKLIVQPTFEGRQTLSLSEKRQLQLPLGGSQSAWVREALLFGKPNQNAWVVARSVFPFASLIGNARKLANLGTTPIGYILFRRHGAVMTNRWIDVTAQGWRRTTLYQWQGRHFLISETFLPAFENSLMGEEENGMIHVSSDKGEG